MVDPEPARSSSRFPTTAWSMVVKAADPQSHSFQESLARLCAMYWYPIFVFIRSRGFTSEEARDHTQEFFACVIEKQYLAGLDRSKGRFRSFVLASICHFLANRLDSERAAKRGGGREILPLECQYEGETYFREPSHACTPEALFEHQWALTLLDRTLKRLRAEYAGPDFNRLKPFLMGEADRGQMAIAAGEMRMSEGAFRVVVHRLRKRYRDALRAEIAETVSEPDLVEGEIRYLLTVLARGGGNRGPDA
jgi:DNA-directed RNA polymerase specialized sigma24 family protein